jgi:protein O-mannosyl-transferase
LGYHVVTLGCHAMAALLLWRVLLALRVPGAWWGAALWALHPVQVESVAWISELKNTQSAVFFLAAVLCWCRQMDASDAARAGGPGIGASPGAGWSYGLTLAFAAAAILSKPSTVMLPVVLALCTWWRQGGLKARDLIALAPCFALSAMAAGWTIWEQKYHSGAIGPEWAMGPVDRVALAGRVIVFYLEKLVWPEPLIFIYPRWQIAPSNPLWYLPVLALGGGIVALVRARHGPLRPVRFAAVTFIALLFPVLGFFDVYFFRYSFVGDHFQYLASMAPCALAAAGLAVGCPRAVAPLGAAALLACGLLTAAHAFDFRDSEALWRATVARHPASAMAWAQLGAVHTRAERRTEAVACFQRALRLNPAHPEALNHLGCEYLRMGRVADAVTELQKAVAARDNFPEAHSNLGLALVQAGRPAEALGHFATTLAARPEAIDTRFHFARSLAALQRWTEAIAEFERVRQMRPDYPGLSQNLGYALIESGRAGQALPLFEAAVQAAPNDPAARENLADAFRLSGQLEAAVTHYRAAVRLAPNRATAHGGWGRAFAALGRTDEAMAEFRQAVALDPGLAEAHNDLGTSLAQAGRLPEALAAFDAAVRADPRHAAAQLNRGGALAQLGRLAEAADALALAAQLQPQSDRPHVYLAQVLQALGREAEAQEHFNQAKRLGSGSR